VPSAAQENKIKALVTGGQGFIGSHVVDQLIERDYEVTVIDDNSSICNQEFYINPKATYHKINICDYEKIKPLFEGVQTVFHLAAESRIQPAILNPIYTTKVNVVGTCNVLQCARETKAERVIYSSTSSGYGLKNTPPLHEKMSKDCLNPYSTTKCAAEEMCVMYTRLFGLKTIILRYFNVYGERQPLIGQYAPVVGLFMEQAKKGVPMTIIGDGTQRRDFTYVGDVIEANMLAATTTKQSAFGEIYNVGTGKNYSILELAKMIGKKYVHIDKRVGEAHCTLADITKISTMLGWKPTQKLEDWLTANTHTGE
jgi:UDP-glucose 4-epimerase